MKGCNNIQLDRVVKGWTEGVPLMREGAKCEFFLPSRLVWEQGKGEMDYPNAVMIFKIELLSIED